MVKYKIWSQSFFEDSGKKSSRAWLVLLIFTLALQTLSTLNCRLSGRDSPRVAGIAREMAVTSNYLIPRLNGENFLEYPSLGYWPIAFTLSMSKNPPDFLAFLPIVFLGTGTVLITYLIGKKLAGEQIGLMAGFILATMPSFITYHRHFKVDPALLFFVTLSLYGFIAGYQSSRKRFLFFALFYLAMAGALLSKGIVGVAIPAATVAVFLITRKDFKAIGKLLLNPAILFFFLPIFLWVGSVWWLEGLGIFKEIIRQSLFRFLSPSADHAKPFYYYFIPALLAPMPWTILLLVLLWYRWRPTPSKEPLPHGFLLRFALVWLLTGLIGLSPLPWAYLSFLCTPGSPRMGPHSREIPKSEKPRALRPDRHILDIHWILPLSQFSFREEREPSACIQGSVKPTDEWPDLFSQPFRDHPRCIILLPWKKDTRTE
jgi:4-amino-4-deoxy-L-arabinose transferase-like glycosyltransferase